MKFTSSALLTKWTVNAAPPQHTSHISYSDCQAVVGWTVFRLKVYSAQCISVCVCVCVCSLHHGVLLWLIVCRALRKQHTRGCEQTMHSQPPAKCFMRYLSVSGGHTGQRGLDKGRLEQRHRQTGFHYDSLKSLYHVVPSKYWKSNVWREQRHHSCWHVPAQAVVAGVDHMNKNNEEEQQITKLLSPNEATQTQKRFQREKILISHQFN